MRKKYRAKKKKRQAKSAEGAEPPPPGPPPPFLHVCLKNETPVTCKNTMYHKDAKNR